MDVTTFLKQIEASGFATWIRDSLYAFPLIESCHVVGLTMVFGTIAIMDLRLLGIASVERPFTKVKNDILKWTWLAFALTVTTGLLMFITNAGVYFHNTQFRFKMALIALSGINMLVFALTAGRSVGRWSNDRIAPRAGRIAGALSLALWIGVIFLGRWVGFTSTRHLEPSQEINLDNIFQ